VGEYNAISHYPLLFNWQDHLAIFQQQLQNFRIRRLLYGALSCGVLWTLAFVSTRSMRDKMSSFS
jgi:hypothetical protein